MSDPHDLPGPARRSDRPTPAAALLPAPARRSAVAAEPEDLDSQLADRAGPAAPGPRCDAVSRQQHQGARNRHNVLLVAGVAAAALGLGGYFLLSSKSNAITPAAYANQSTRISAAEPVPAPTTARTPAAEAPFAAAVPQARVVFDPPPDYASNSLTADPGCVGYNDATNASSAALGDSPTAAEAAAALADLGASLAKSSAEAQDPTLSAALAAESAFVLQAQPTLATALTSGDSDREVAAYQPIEDTDNYVSAVCGSDLDGGGPGD
ncbi:MAG TPA: hypothetical protein VGX23_04080 [Actinocrinis sp.]|nr:hypothetical protein [Actinocrinis sp.]